MPWLLASSLPSQNPSLHTFQSGDRLELGAHLTYQSFLNSVEELVDYWGPDREFEPGWTPRELAEDITRRFTDELWNRQDDPFQTRVLELLNVRSASYDIYSPNFPCFELFAAKGMCRRSNETISSPWLRAQVVKDISGVRFRTNLDKIRSAGLASNFELSLVTLDRFFKALSALFGKHHDYHRWVKKMDLALYRNCYRIFFEEKKSEVVFATMKGCLEVLELIRLRSKGSYGPGKMLAYYHPTLEGFFEMCGLLPSRSYVQKELEDVDNWHRFSVRNRESAQPPVFKDSNRPSHQQPPNATDWRQLSILVLTVARRYRADYGDWGYFVGDRLNVLVEEAKSSGDDHSYHTLDHYLRELLACRVSELPTPQKIPPAIWEIGVPPYIVPHVS